MVEKEKKSVFDRFLQKSKRGGGLSGSLRGMAKQRPGANKGTWKDRWVPPQQSTTSVPEQILLFKGDYHQVYGTPEGDKEVTKEYYVYYSHFSAHANKGRGSGTQCAAGLFLVPNEDGDLVSIPGDGECVPCYNMNEGIPSVRVSRNFAFNAIRPGYFHKVPGPNINPRTKKPYMEWVRCQGKNCKHCKALVKKEYGLRVYWPMGIRFAEQLMAYEETKLSMVCKCGDALHIEGFTCSKCEECVVDLESDPMDDEQITAFRSQERACPYCGHVDLYVAQRSCETCGSAEGLTLWDVILEVTRTGDGTDSSLMILGFTALDEDTKSKLEEKMKPFDFENGPLRIESHEAVSKRLQLENPYVNRSQSGSTNRVNWKK